MIEEQLWDFHPTKKSGNLRRGILALVVLLVATVLLVGAGSATGETTDFTKNLVDSDFAVSQDDHSDIAFKHYAITQSGTYTLTQSVQGNITIDVKDGGTVTLVSNDKENVKLTGMIVIYNATEVNVVNMHIVLDGSFSYSATWEADTMYDYHIPAIVTHPVQGEGIYESVKLNVIGNIIDSNGVPETQDVSSPWISSFMFMDRGLNSLGDSTFIGNKVLNVTGDVINLNTLEADRVDVWLNDVTMKPAFGDSMYTTALLSIIALDDRAGISQSYSLVNNKVVVYGEKQSSILLVNGHPDDTYEETSILFSGNTYNGDEFSPNLYLRLPDNGIDADPERIGTFFVTDKFTDLEYTDSLEELAQSIISIDKNLENILPNLNILLVEGLNQSVDGEQFVSWNNGHVTILSNEIPYLSDPSKPTTLSINTVKNVVVNGVDITTSSLNIEGKNSIANTYLWGYPEETLTAKNEISTNLFREIKWTIADPTIIYFSTGYDEFVTDESTDQVTYTASGVAGTTTVTAVTSGGVSEKVTITAYRELTPEFHLVSVEDKGNKVLNISGYDNGQSFSLSQDNKVLTLATDFGVYLGIFFSDENGAKVTVTTDQNTMLTQVYVEGQIASMRAIYPDALAVSGFAGIPVDYALTLYMSLNEFNGNFILPTISPALADDAETNVKAFNQNYVPIAMITASAPVGSTLDAINKNVDKVKVSFTVPASFVTEKGGKSKFYVLHVKDGEPTKRIDVSDWKEDGNNLQFIIESEYGFSEYIAVVDETPASPTTPGTGGDPGDTTTGGSYTSGSSVWLTETQTPTQQPTETPTDTIPTEIPTTQPTQTETQSPGFGIFAVLTGLGAVVAIRRK